MLPVAIQKNWFLHFLETHASKNAKTILKIDWSQTTLGPIDTWPENLKSSLSICLNATDRPIAIYWYEPKIDDFLAFFNDSFLLIVYQKKAPLGQPASVLWSEIWSTIGPQYFKVIQQKKRLFSETNHSLWIARVLKKLFSTMI